MTDLTLTSLLLKLNNGVEMPALGFGAMNTDAAAVTTALEAGYFDAAARATSPAAAT
jgi:diketogulonate reductase-like aldo/keto reductase